MLSVVAGMTVRPVSHPGRWTTTSRKGLMECTQKSHQVTKNDSICVNEGCEHYVVLDPATRATKIKLISLLPHNINSKALEKECHCSEHVIKQVKRGISLKPSTH